MNHPLFKDCDIDLSIYKEVKYQKNDIIFNEGEQCNYIGLIIKGIISVNTYTYIEQEYSIVQLKEGDLFGEVIMFGDVNQYLGNVLCVKDSVIVFISKNQLLSLFKNETILSNYLLILSNKILSIQNKVKILSQKTIRDKIMFYLLNKSKLNKTQIIKISSKERLANYLNIPRPSLSRELINLNNDNIIEMNRNIIKIKSPF